MPTIPSIFEGREEAAKAYAEVTQFAKTLGKFAVEEKKTCLHFVAGGTAFLGIHPRKEGLRMTAVLNQAVKSKRMAKCEKASANRYHVDFDFIAADGLDDEAKAWIRESYERSLTRAR